MYHNVLVILMFKQTYHILSDLHLEHRLNISSLDKFVKCFPQLKRNGYCPNDEENKQKILILAGDIGYPSHQHYWSFLQDSCLKYKHVMCIPGNHEYYDKKHTIAETNELIKEKSSEIENLHFLVNESVDIDNVTYVGTTLWSQLQKSQKKDIVDYMNDFNYIKTHQNTYLTFEDYINLHNECLNWLTNKFKSLKENNVTNIVTITHHLPSFQLMHPKYSGSTINSAFYNNLDDLMTGKLWISGHTHSNITKNVNGVPVVVNPFGYCHECMHSLIQEISIDFD